MKGKQRPTANVAQDYNKEEVAYNGGIKQLHAVCPGSCCSNTSPNNAVKRAACTVRLCTEKDDIASAFSLGNMNLTLHEMHLMPKRNACQT